MIRLTRKPPTDPSAPRTRPAPIYKVPTAPTRKGTSSNIRVLRTNLVYAIGLWPQICSQSILASPDYFGKYGNVLKIAIIRKPSIDRKQPQGSSYSALVTYEDKVSASVAVLSLFEFKPSNGALIRCCYGYAKYCDLFYNGRTCKKHYCPYMHQFADEREMNLQRGQGYQKDEFETHFSMAVDVVVKDIATVTGRFDRIQPNTGTFPHPYDSLKILIDHHYLTEQEYQRKWSNQQLDEKRLQLQETNRPPTSTTTKSDPSSSESAATDSQQQRAAQLDMEQRICNKIITKIQKRFKVKSKLYFMENKPTSPRFIEQFKLFFSRQQEAAGEQAPQGRQP